HHHFLNLFYPRKSNSTSRVGSQKSKPLIQHHVCFEWGPKSLNRPLLPSTDRA
ncbi:hypothetical protein NDU88_008941, partial [Pleurodeles waltl]